LLGRAGALVQARLQARHQSGRNCLEQHSAYIAEQSRRRPEFPKVGIYIFPYVAQPDPWGDGLPDTI